VVVLLVFGLVGMGLLVGAVKFWDWMTGKIDEQQCLKDGNMAVATVMSVYLLTVAWIIVTVVSNVLGH
jgi:hypothetical protein